MNAHSIQILFVRVVLVESSDFFIDSKSKLLNNNFCVIFKESHYISVGHENAPTLDASGSKPANSWCHCGIQVSLISIIVSSQIQCV